VVSRLVAIFMRTRDDAGVLVPVSGATPPFARGVARESRRVLWVPRNMWLALIGAQAVLVVLVAVGLNAGVNALTDTLEASGVRSAPIPRRTALFGIVSLEAICFGAVVATILVFRPAWLLAKARQRVAAGICGSCAYDLRALELDGRGLTVCPECGAAWNRRRRRATPREWARGITPPDARDDPRDKPTSPEPKPAPGA
jgi:hypothetical protein